MDDYKELIEELDGARHALPNEGVWAEDSPRNVCTRAAEAIERLSAENELYAAEMSAAKEDGFYSAQELFSAYREIQEDVRRLSAELEEAKKEAQHYGEFCGKFRHEIAALKSASAEPVVKVDYNVSSGLLWLDRSAPMPPHGSFLYLHPAPEVQSAEPVAWFHKANGRVYLTTSPEPDEDPREVGYAPVPNWQPLYLHAPAAVPEGWQLVPKEPTEEMCRAGESSKGGSSSTPWIDGDYTPENVEQIYRDMLNAAPKTPVQEDAKDAARLDLLIDLFDRHLIPLSLHELRMQVERIKAGKLPAIRRAAMESNHAKP